MPDTDEAIDRLYGLALDEFTPARDELARELRGAGDRDTGAEVKRLRKPSVAAWALNRARRREPGLADELLDAGAHLREGQEQLLAGKGREGLDRATEEERRLVGELARAAERELEQAGRSPSGSVREKLRSTLHAVASDSEAREAFAAGRLVRDHEASGLGTLVGDAPPRRATKEAAAAKAEAAKAETARRRRARDLDKRLERARRRLKDARDEATRAAAELERAELTLDQLERERAALEE